MIGSTGVVITVLAGMLTACRPYAPERPPAAPAAASTQRLEPYRDSISGTLVGFDMTPVPGDTVTAPTPDGPRVVDVPSFWIGKTEVTWDEYDVFAFRLDLPPQERAADVDATLRPSRPYGAPDWGFGHAGYPAMSVTYHAAASYAAWLAAKTGKRYRLPTDAEWTLAARLGFGEHALSWTRLDSVAWYRANAEAKTHPVAAKHPDSLGLYDMLGNVVEWVTGPAGKRLARGGSYRDRAEHVGPEARATQTTAWNMTDPQIPKSRWWLSDAPFAGFRIVREP